MMMKNINRREFIGKSIAAGSAMMASMPWPAFGADAQGKKAKMPLGFQVWTLRDKLVSDFPGTLKMMANLGYRSVEMCSPPGYENAGFGPLMKLKPKEMLQIIQDAGLAFESTHYGMGELRKDLDNRIAFAAESGQKQMILSSFGLPSNASLDDWMKAADELNQMGMKTKAAGIQMGYHNHHMEFEKINGTLIYDALLKQFDPGYVKMQFQVAVISIGYKAAGYFKKYPGRFISAHLADWSPEEKKNVALGRGVVDWQEFFRSTKKGGIENIFVEMDPDTFKESAEFYRDNLLAGS